MMNDFLIEILPLLGLVLLMVFVLLVGSFWYHHYSRDAKALHKRLSDIVNMRNSVDEQLIKSSEDQTYTAFQALALSTQINEAIKLMILRAGVELTVPRFLLITLSLLATGLVFFGLIVKTSLMPTLLLSIIFATLPLLCIKHLEKKRASKIEHQLPEALDFVCRSLRAGHGLAVSFGMVGDELPNPIAKEFKTVFEEINFGLPFNEAMSNFAMRTNSNDINFLVVGLLIQREAGGNLIELLENLSKTIRDRMILSGKIRILASEGKYSGISLSTLPLLLGGILTFMNPKYMSILWTSESGQEMVLTGIVMLLLGGLWMWSITRIKV